MSHLLAYIPGCLHLTATLPSVVSSPALGRWLGFVCPNQTLSGPRWRWVIGLDTDACDFGGLIACPRPLSDVHGGCPYPNRHRRRSGVEMGKGSNNVAAMMDMENLGCIK
ncbi:hypothetical protein QVD17_05936 [Tagetes erecta]|uniref:Uncharacterized protein n=1 Tax=Tagetes erecta TaxID=13708 RepID=A0AAD8LJM4_TARER|nr:hypothetical protein QVD17_05936 [Tagetes erecta]